MPTSHKPLLPDEISTMWKYIEKEMNKHKRKKKRAYYLWSSSAAAILLAAVLVFQDRLFPREEPPAGISSIEQVKKPSAVGKDIQLILNGGEEISLEEVSAEVKHGKDGNISVNEKKLAQAGRQVDPEKIQYNQLIVPFGKRSTLLLPDGTKLWLNAGSRVVYPSDFSEDIREIYVEGEVFLDVTKEARRAFVVKTGQMRISVLGTSFNVMTGETGESPQVVLVEGSVKVDTKDRQTRVIRPNERLSYLGDRLIVHPVDVQKYISWKEGIFLFRSEPLSDILKRLSRYYGCKIECDPSVASLKCSGKLDLRDRLDPVLTTLTRTAPVAYHKQNQVYKIEKSPYKTILPMDRN